MLSLRRISYWLLGIVTVIVALLLVLPFIVDSDYLKTKLQTTIDQQTGGQMQYQAASLVFLPRPSITLHQITLDIPDLSQGTVGSVQVYPELFALLTGQLRIAELVLDSPEVSLVLPKTDASKEEKPAEFNFVTLQGSLGKALEPLTKVTPDLSLVINNGTLAFSEGTQALGSLQDLKLKLKLDATDPGSLQAKLQGSVTTLTLYRDYQKIVVEDVGGMGSLKADNAQLLLTIDDLALSKPKLQLKGRLAVNSTSPVFDLNLHGTDLDVDMTRETALTLAGDINPVKVVFDYLRGGTVPQISFQTQGETASELGALKDLHIKGQLQKGAVSIPQIKLDLTEVNGNVEIADGVLVGTGVSTRLEGSAGHDGTVKVALTEDNDLFQMELMLSADLAQAQNILKRVVEESEFAKLVDKITNLQGTSIGKLTLGDSLSDIKARVDMSDLNLTADYQGLPFPVDVTKGRLLFAENRIELKDLNGSLGGSTFSGLTCNVDWVDTLKLDLISGTFGLVLDELYPWLANLDGTKESLKEFKQITGRMDLATVRLKGAVGTVKNWQVAGTGTIKGLGIETSRFPGKIELAEGDFTLDAEKLAFQNLKMDGLDASLVLSGALEGLPQKLDQVELSLDGKIGRDSVAWLKETLGLPMSSETPEKTEAYTLRTPLKLSETKILWQPISTTSFKGNVTIDEGPELTLDIDYLPEQLQVKRLTVKDQNSDAVVAFTHGQDEFNLNFTGTLHHKTLESLFVDKKFGSGQLQGDFDVKVPLAKQSAPAAKGRLEGMGLVIPLSSGDDIAIEQLLLTADGSRGTVDATAVSWNNFNWAPVKATVDFNQDKIDVEIAEAKLCGIDSSGLLSIAGKDLILDFTLYGKGLDVTTSYTCLTEGRVKMTGTLDFSSTIHAQGQVGTLTSTMNGPLEMKFTKGTIVQSKLLARTLEVLNVTEIVKGKLPDLVSTGFKYSSIDVTGAFQGDKLILKKIYMDGDTLAVLGNGEIDIEQKTLDIELLAAPFKTVDTVVKNIPGVNYLLAGSLVTIPVSIKGAQSDPKVRVMSASSVGSSLLGLGSRVIKSPLKLIETITPGQNDKKN